MDKDAKIIPFPGNSVMNIFMDHDHKMLTLSFDKPIIEFSMSEESVAEVVATFAAFLLKMREKKDAE